MNVLVVLPNEMSPTIGLTAMTVSPNTRHHLHLIREVPNFEILRKKSMALEQSCMIDLRQNRNSMINHVMNVVIPPSDLILGINRHHQAAMRRVMKIRTKSHPHTWVDFHT